MSIERGSDPNVDNEFKKHPKRTVAVVFLVRSDKRFLFVRTKRLPNQWQPIGGGMKPFDKDVVDTAAREVFEETGYEVSNNALKKIFVTEYDFGEGRVHFFITQASQETSFTFDMNELEEWRWVSLNEARALPVFPATGRCLVHLEENNYL